MEKRPRIKLELTSIDKMLELTCFLMVLGFWIHLILNYPGLPETIPTHFNAAGEADGFGKKSSIFMLPIIASILYALMTVLNFFPHIYNFPTKITPENAFRQYTNATQMIRVVKLGLLLLFFSIEIKTVKTAIGKAEGLGDWFLPLTFLLLVFPLIFFTTRMFKKD